MYGRNRKIGGARWFGGSYDVAKQKIVWIRALLMLSQLQRQFAHEATSGTRRHSMNLSEVCAIHAPCPNGAGIPATPQRYPCPAKQGCRCNTPPFHLLELRLKVDRGHRQLNPFGCKFALVLYYNRELSHLYPSV